MGLSWRVDTLHDHYIIQMFLLCISNYNGQESSMVLHFRSVHVWNRCNVILGGLERGISTALYANIAAYHALQ